ncbi:hypothetical protein ACQPZJ_17675 [Actinoplanes sp. CA-054009]
MSAVRVLLPPPIGAVIGVAVLWLVAAVLSSPPGFWSVAGLSAFGAVAGTLLVAWSQGRLRAWIRVSEAGVEMAARGAGVLVAWDEIASARVRRSGLFAVLEVEPRDLYALRVAQPSRDLPRVRQRDGRAVLVMDAGFFRPGPVELTRALAAAQPTQQ